MQTKALIVIPARYPSSRLPGKPLVDIGGIPMIVRTAMQARKANLAAVVYTEDADASHAGHATVQAAVDVNSRVLYLSRAFIPATKTGARIEGHPYRYVHGFYGFRKAALEAYDGRETDGWKHEDIDQLLALESGFPLYAIGVPWVEPSVNTPEDLELVREIVAKKS